MTLCFHDFFHIIPKSLKICFSDLKFFIQIVDPNVKQPAMLNHGENSLLTYFLNTFSTILN